MFSNHEFFYFGLIVDNSSEQPVKIEEKKVPLFMEIYELAN